MAGHNKWSKVKHKKAVVDAKKSKEFSKLSKLITMEAKQAGGLLARGKSAQASNTDSPGLKLAIEKAKKANMPNDNIERAIKKAVDSGSENVESVTYEAYGPGGVAIIIETLTDNRNRTAGEMKHLLSTLGVSIAEPGAASWAFEKMGAEWQPKTTVPIGEEERQKLEEIVEKIREHDDVQEVYDNAS